MARSPWLAPVAILLVVLTFMTGCVSGSSRRQDERSTISSVEDGTHGGAQKARGGGDALAIMIVYGAVGFIIVGAVVVDLLLLPYTLHCHKPFCCTQTVIHVCHR